MFGVVGKGYSVTLWKEKPKEFAGYIQEHLLLDKFPCFKGFIGFEIIL